MKRSKPLVLRATLLALAVIIPPGSISAQDIAPVISPGQAADGIYRRSVAERQARRIREGRTSSSTPCADCLGSKAYPILPGTTAGQARACYSLPSLRKKYNADDPKLQHLQSLCKQAGY